MHLRLHLAGAHEVVHVERRLAGTPSGEVRLVDRSRELIERIRELEIGVLVMVGVGVLTEAGSNVVRAVALAP